MLKYIFLNRKKTKILSKEFFKIFLKRIYNIPPLLKILFYHVKYKISGANLADISIIDGTIIKGKLNKLSVGYGSYVAKDVSLALHANIYIGSCVVLNSGAKLLTGTHDVDNKSWPLIAKNIVIEDYAWISMNAIILPGVKVGQGAVVGAGAVVSKDVPPYAVVVGNPGVIKKYRKRIEFKYIPASSNAAIEAWLGKGFERS